ncbi:uncharacterized protein [Rutidosis leptorrhynchoides]|uniref:uncharacterized protein n=1 Tax=Rutidosis leptorrhynchoides TaxID=125765 RepID=UPI003A98FA42
MLQIRPTVRGFFMPKLGNGFSTHGWFDDWSGLGALSSVISRRDIFMAGFSDKTMVGELVDHNVLRWPPDLLHKYPTLSTINCPMLTNEKDYTVWKYNDKVVEFSVFHAWNAIRPQAPVVDWFPIVWYSQCIPCHAFLLWMVIKKKLKTQDRLRDWEVQNGSNLVCVFCKRCVETHEHLFFECEYSAAVWMKVKTRIQMVVNSTQYLNIMNFLRPIAARNRVDLVVVKLVFAASIYFVWQERNNRCFKGKMRSDQCLADVILSTVWIKLFSLRFKESPQVAAMKLTWLM